MEQPDQTNTLSDFDVQSRAFSRGHLENMHSSDSGGAGKWEALRWRKSVNVSLGIRQVADCFLRASIIVWL